MPLGCQNRRRQRIKEVVWLNVHLYKINHHQYMRCMQASELYAVMKPDKMTFTFNLFFSRFVTHSLIPLLVTTKDSTRRSSRGLIDDFCRNRIYAHMRQQKQLKCPVLTKSLNSQAVQNFKKGLRLKNVVTRLHAENRQQRCESRGIFRSRHGHQSLEKLGRRQSTTVWVTAMK